MSSTRHRNTRFIRYRGGKTIDELKNSKNLQHTFTLENFGDSKSFWSQFIAVIGVELWSNRCTINNTMVWPLLIGLISFLFVRFDVHIPTSVTEFFPDSSSIELWIRVNFCYPTLMKNKHVEDSWTFKKRIIARSIYENCSSSEWHYKL